MLLGTSFPHPLEAQVKPEVDGSLKAYQAKGQSLSGPIAAGSSETLKRMMDLWTKGFHQHHSGVAIDTTLIKNTEASQAIFPDVQPILAGAKLVALSHPLSEGQLFEIKNKLGVQPIPRCAGPKTGKRPSSVAPAAPLRGRQGGSRSRSDGSAANVCAECGFQNKPGIRYCANCGMSLAGAVADPGGDAASSADEIRTPAAQPPPISYPSFATVSPYPTAQETDSRRALRPAAAPDIPDPDAAIAMRQQEGSNRRRHQR